MVTKMTNAKMERAAEALSKYTKATGKIGYAVARNLQALKTALTPYITVKQAILAEHAKPDTEHPGMYIVDDDKKDEMAELMAIECELDIYQLDEETFIGWGLPAEEMEPLIWMVDEWATPK